jgi:NAD(P)H-dependent FMN reductase
MAVGTRTAPAVVTGTETSVIASLGLIDASGDTYSESIDFVATPDDTDLQGSNTSKVANLVLGLYKELGVDVQMIDLGGLPPEIFHRSSYAEKPPGFSAFTDKIINADGLVVVSPEYNGGIPGVLKYFIDMLPFPESFERRPVCFVGLAAGQWGALRPVEQLQAIFVYRNAHIYPERVFIPGIGNALTEEGTFTDEKLLGRLKKQATGFVEFVGRLKGLAL